MTPGRGLLTVRYVETPETLPHGRVILTLRAREELTAGQMEVVAIGAPSVCEDDECERPHTGDQQLRTHPTTTKPRDWVLIQHRALSETDEEHLYCCAQDAVLAILEAK